MSFITAHKDGVTISIRVTTKSSKSGPLEVIADSLKWGVNAPPVDGKANQALIADIAKRLKIAKSKISILKGEHSKEKVLLIAQIQPFDVLNCLFPSAKTK